MKINNKKIAILFLLISLVLLTSCVVSAADNSNGTSTDTQKNVNTPETTTTHSDTNTQSTNTQEQTTSDTNNQVSSDTQTSSQSTSQSSTSSNTQTTTKESSSSSQGTNQEQSTTQSTNSTSSTQSVSTDKSVSTQSVNTDKQLSQEESDSNNQTITESIEDTQNNTQTNSVDSSQLVNTNKELKTATYTVSTYSQLLNVISTIKSTSSSSSNTINLVSGTTYKVTSPILLSSTSYSKTITINGNGAIIDGQGSYAFISVKTGYTVTIKDMTIQNCRGRVLTNYESVIQNYGGTVTISNVTLKNNKYGVILNAINETTNKKSSMTVTNCTIINNRENCYTGIVTNQESTMTITNTIFRNNSVSNIGCVLYNHGGTLKLTGSSFINNSNSDGMILNENLGSSKGVMNVTTSVFTNNTASEGGVFGNIGTLTITKSNFTNNKAYYGGSYLEGGVIYTSAGTVSVGSSIFTNNEAKYGKVLLVAGGTAKFNNNTFIYTYSVDQSTILYKEYSGSYTSTNNIFRINVKSTSISIDDTTANTNKSKTFTAYIKASDSSYPTGSVKISIDGKTITSTIGSSGKISFSYTFTKSGTYSVTISYAGNSNYDASSKTFKVSVSTIVVDTYITTSNKNATVNKTTNLYGYVKASDNTIPKGSVTFTVNGKNYTSSIGSDGYVHLSYKFVNYGSYSVKISYAGSSSYKSSSSTFTVNIPVPTTSTVSSYKELYNTIETIKSYSGSGTYTINLVDGSFKITNTINWGSTKGIKNLIINGNGVNIYGSSQKQFLNISSGYTVTLKNLGLMNCYATNGGSIINSGTLNLDNCVFNNSKATNGGAIYSSGNLDITKSKFTNNQATKYGGSIYICSSSPTNISYTSFTSNYALTGGAIYNNGYCTYITYANFTNNRATTGGAIYNKNYVNTYLLNFTTNSAESGGAVYNTGSNTKMEMYLTNFNNNTALYGGGIFNYKNSYLLSRESNFNYNRANNGEAIRNKNATISIAMNYFTYTSSSESNVIVSDAYMTTSGIFYTRANKLDATINISDSMFVTSNSGTLTGTITDSNNKLITDTLTVTFSINNKNITTQTVKNGKINVTLDLSSFSSGIYNITTTLKESSNYTSANATTVLFKNKKHSILVTSVSGKNGETVTFKAYISDKNGNRATSGSTTFKINGVTLKDSKGRSILASLKNGVVTYNYTIPTSYSAKDYTLTAVTDSGGRIENTAKLTILKTDQKLTAGTAMFVSGNKAQLTGTIVDVNGKTTTRDTKVAIKINGQTVMNTVVTNGKLNVTLDLSKYSSGAYTIEIVLGENGCYNTGYANMTLIKNLKNSVVVMPTNNTIGTTSTLTAFVTDSNGNRQSSGTVSFKINGTSIGSAKISNGVANITYNTLLYNVGTYNLTVSTTVNGKTLTNSTTLRIKS